MVSFSSLRPSLRPSTHRPPSTPFLNPRSSVNQARKGEVSECSFRRGERERERDEPFRYPRESRGSLRDETKAKEERRDARESARGRGDEEEIEGACGRTPEVAVDPHDALFSLDGRRIGVQVEECRRDEADLCKRRTPNEEEQDPSVRRFGAGNMEDEKARKRRKEN